MAPALNTVEKTKFGSFAVLDFETSNIPAHRYNKVGLTELSIYGIALSEFNNTEVNVEGKLTQPPALPRVLHKLTLMVNPMMAIDPEAERVTGLNNYMLEAESKFDENAGQLLLSFLNRLQQPVCLVAHNGYGFDFPILRYVLERIGFSLPDTMYALDSLRAFHDIDITLENAKQAQNSSIDEIENIDQTHVKSDESIARTVNKDETGVEVNAAIAEPVIELKHEEKEFDARSINETTPKRGTKHNINLATRKRLRPAENDVDENDVDDGKVNEPSSSKILRLRRTLNFDETPTCSTNKERRKSGKKWFPPKNIYKLPNIFLRVFSRDPILAHYAEADVKTLTHLMLHYGLYFVDYAKKHAIKFSEIPQLGRPNNI